MNIKLRTIALAASGMLFATQLLATPPQHPTAGPELHQMMQLRRQQLILQRNLRQLQKKLALEQDEELKALKAEQEAAQKAYNEKLREKTASTPEGKELLEQIDELGQQMETLKTDATSKPAPEPPPAKAE